MNLSAPVVLVVEGEPIAETFCAVLKQQDFLPFHVQTVAEARKLLAMVFVDAMVLDVQLPDPSGRHKSGMSLLVAVKSIPMYATLPVAIFTRTTLSTDDRDLAIQCGATVFYKPQPYARLINYLNGRLGREALANSGTA